MTLKEAKKILEEGGIENALFDARAIFSEIEKIPPHNLVSQDTECSSDEVADAIRRRAKREPLQYIIGKVEFYKERYAVSRDCLIPRADTEVLVDFAVNNLPSGCKFLDLCTGSGCIAISTLANTVSTTAVAVDISGKALALAKINADTNGVSERISFVSTDVTKSKIDGNFFAILSNPPYVTDRAYEELEPEIYFEPKEAFVGGEDGADFYRVITELYKDSIPEDGFIAYEIGYDQADVIDEIARKNGMSSEIIRDFSSNPRVAVLRKTKN